MKQLINLTCTILLLFSCTSKKDVPIDEPPVKFPEKAKDMVIYEVNLRQHTPEGTFNAFADDISRLKKMGIDILWLMPIQPIGVKNRKGGLGSYYSISDYLGVNPEFGTMEDFKNLVNRIHDADMLVILDWVANHTAWDHPWMTEREGYYTKDSLGNIIPPVPDWSDVADLNYDNRAMQDEMIEALRFWVNETDIDGYRCDVAWGIEMDFWDRAKDSLDRDKDVFMLAEADEPKMHSAFHASYGWGLHHVMNEVAKGHQNADSLEAFVRNDIKAYGEKAFRMNFTTNHDENSWNGTVFERYGDGHFANAVLAFTLQGIPLVYGGQEAGLDWRLRFFEKDTIKWGDYKFQDFYTTLIKFKKDNPALYNGEFGGQPEFLETGNSNVIAYQRTNGDNAVNVIINLSGDTQTVDLTNVSIDFTDHFTQSTVNSSLSKLEPYQYFIGSN